MTLPKIMPKKGYYTIFIAISKEKKKIIVTQDKTENNQEEGKKMNNILDQISGKHGLIHKNMGDFYAKLKDALKTLYPNLKLTELENEKFMLDFDSTEELEDWAIIIHRLVNGPKIKN